MDNSDFELLGTYSVPYLDIDVTQYDLRLRGRALELTKGLVFGIDPGSRNFGAACAASPDSAWAFQCLFPAKQMSVPRITRTSGLLIFLLGLLPFVPTDWKGVPACVENAAFGAQGRQVSLSESRTAAAAALLARGCSVRIKPPQSIRKAVFGSAKIRAQDVWPDIGPDAASALACALAARYV